MQALDAFFTTIKTQVNGILGNCEPRDLKITTPSVQWGNKGSPAACPQLPTCLYYTLYWSPRCWAFHPTFSLKNTLWRAELYIPSDDDNPSAFVLDLQHAYVTFIVSVPKYNLPL